VLRPSQLLPVGCAGTLRRASLSEICWAPPRLIIQRAVTRLTRSGGSRPELRLLRCRSSSGNSLYGQNSAGFRESARPFKGIICDDISEFESYHPSHAVRSPWAMSGLTALPRPRAPPVWSEPNGVFYLSADRAAFAETGAFLKQRTPPSEKAMITRDPSKESALSGTRLRRFSATVLECAVA
jgi:hypothetical protein